MIEVNRLYKILITILLILQFYFFDLIPRINDWLINANSEYSKRIQFFIFLIMLVILLLSKKGTENVKMNFSVPIILFLIIIPLIAWSSAQIYNQGIIDTIFKNYSYYLLIGYFPFSYFFSDRKNVRWFYILLVKMAFVYLILQNIQGIIFKLTHHIVLFYTPVAIQNLTILQRFTEGTEIITFVAVLISLKPFLFHEQWQKNEYLTILLILTFDIFFSQGRMYLMIVIVALAISGIFQLYSSKFRSVVYIFTPFMLVILVFLFNKLVTSLNFTNTTGARAASYIMRTYSYDYFCNHIFYNSWFGIGFPDINQYKWLLKGSVGFDPGGGLMTSQDVGIVGTAGILGISSLVFFIMIFLKLLSMLASGINKKTILIVLVYISMSLISLSPLDMGRMFPFILTLALCDFSQTAVIKTSTYKIYSN